MRGDRSCRRWLQCGLLACGLLCAWGASAASLRVGSTGSAAPLIRLLFEEFRKEEPSAQLDLAAPPLGTGGALRALGAGQIDLAVAGRALKAEEKSRVGPHFDLAATPFVMATPDGVRPGGFSLNELAAVYRGDLQKWDGGKPIRLVLRAGFESDNLQLRSMAPSLDAALEIAAQRPGMAVGKDDLDTLALLTQTSGAFGPTSLGLISTVGASLKLMPLDGVMPSLATLRSGQYPWRKSLTVVLPAKPSPLAQRFAAFLRGSKAGALMIRYDYLPLEP